MTEAGRALEIRDALREDAEAACEVLRQSITELCHLDHKKDPSILAQWLRKKTPDIVESWIAEEGNSVLVAIDEGAVVAVGAVTDAGDITSNYVSPQARFRGVSRAMMSALELRAVTRGNKQCTLTSTATARSFYHALGYTETGPPDCKYGMDSGFPMVKQLRD